MQPTYIQYHTQGKSGDQERQKNTQIKKKLKKIVTVIIVLPKCSTSREIKQQVTETVSNNQHQREKQMKHKYKHKHRKIYLLKNRQRRQLSIVHTTNQNNHRRISVGNFKSGYYFLNGLERSNSYLFISILK